MDFGYTPQNEAFRQEVRQFIVDNVTSALREELAQGRLEGRGPLTKALFRKLGSKGWIGMSWPKEYGGQERDLVEQYIFEEEFVRAGIPLDLNNILVLLTQFGNYLSNYMISLVQKIDIANFGEIYHLDPSGGSRHAYNPEEPS